MTASNHRPRPEDGYELWLRYRMVEDPRRRTEYARITRSIHVPSGSPVLAAARTELALGIKGLLGTDAVFTNDHKRASLSVSARTEEPMNGPDLTTRSTLSRDGFTISVSEGVVNVVGNGDRGALYGVFHLLRRMQLGVASSDLPATEAPRIGLRMLNHWDNPSGTVERGYAGSSLWNWHLLPDFVDPRYVDYARAMASVGLNATCPLNVNADARVLTPDFIRKVASLADVWRPYGIRIFLAARFNAPQELGDTQTADPLDPAVIAWWQARVRMIYTRIPDFGGFVVKASSEGQPGPQDYGRSHAAGANLLARALAPFGGIVIWRAFVYDHRVPEDRCKQAHDEFVPLDGEFDENVMLQVKNGPLDFQPREPFHPLLGALSRTPAMLELQLTQEYTGQGTHLVYLATLFAEVLRADTHARGKGSTVARIVDGSCTSLERTGIAGVSNVGNDRNWCGHPFAQSNWFAFGRLAWDPRLEPGTIADEWLKLTFSQAPEFVTAARHMMLASHAVCVDTMAPLGLHHLMAKGHHYGPGPWANEGRPDWTAVYYHRADAEGIGFDRTSQGSDAVSQYFSPVREQFDDPSQCPEEFLLWFHHLPWAHPMPGGVTLWTELCRRYQRGVEGAERLEADWLRLEGYVDAQRFQHVRSLLGRQVQEARWWRDASIAYFRTFSRATLPEGVPEPEHDLAHYMAVESFPVPGAPWRT